MAVDLSDGECRDGVNVPLHTEEVDVLFWIGK
jgi:hypothetical protein